MCVGPSQLQFTFLGHSLAIHSWDETIEQNVVVFFFSLMLFFFFFSKKKASSVGILSAFLQKPDTIAWCNYACFILIVDVSNLEIYMYSCVMSSLRSGAIHLLVLRDLPAASGEVPFLEGCCKIHESHISA